MKKQFTFICGVILGASLAIAGTVAYADNIDVSLIPLKIFVNGVDKTPVDNQFNNNGSVVAAEIIYNGTTYVPLRMASNLLGTPISYDGANKTIHLGTDPANNEYLSDIQPYAVTDSFGGLYTGTMSNNDLNKLVGNGLFPSHTKTMTMGGTSYSKGVSVYESGFGSKVFYNLNGKYNSMTGLVGFDDSSDPGADKTVNIIEDGKQIWSYEFKIGDLPKPISLPLTGVLQLEFEILDNQDTHNVYVDIVNPVLK